MEGETMWKCELEKQRSKKTNRTKDKNFRNEENKAFINVGIRNEWGINGKGEKINQKLKDMKIHILGISEIKRKGKEYNNSEGRIMRWCGVEKGRENNRKTRNSENIYYIKLIIEVLIIEILNLEEKRVI